MATRIGSAGHRENMINPFARGRSTTRSPFRASLLCATLLCIAACVADPDFVHNSDGKAILDAYRVQEAQTADLFERRRAHEIQRLEVTHRKAADELVLSATLNNARLDMVLAQILRSPHVHYRANSISIAGRVSARFSDLPLIEGLNVLLSDTGISATGHGQLVELKYGGPNSRALSPEASMTGLESREIRLAHLSSVDVVSLLSDLYPPDEYNDEQTFSASSIPELNAVFVSGTPALVEAAHGVVARADRPVAHVIIEALVVNINTSTVESLGITLEDISDGNLSAASIIPSQTGGNLVATFSELASNSLQVSATIDFLAARNAAQVLARPYISTRSNKTASIEIVDDQFARVDTSGDGDSIITTDSVTAGTTMEITPVVMADEAIRLDVRLEDSSFSATAGDIVISRERSTASTSMIVKSGQTIVIGGLNARNRLSANSGIPGLRHVPLLNALMGDQGALETRHELVVYLTPYIWRPGMDTPMPEPRTPSPDLPYLTGMEAGRPVN